MVQRRIVHRRFYLRPDARTTEIFLYCLAYAVRCTGVRLHDFTVMSNHYHVVLTDPEGKLPKFQQILNSFVARAVNATYGTFGSLWERESYTAPLLADDADMLEKCVYTLANPCSAHIVEHPREWPGASSWAMEYGQARVVQRPPVVFSERMPPELPLVLTRPPIEPQLSHADLRREIRERVLERTRELAKDRQAQKRSVMGIEAVRRQRRDDSPRTNGGRFVPIPRVASSNRWAREEAKTRDRAWLRDYRHALEEFKKNPVDARFPEGTYLMRVRYGLACASP